MNFMLSIPNILWKMRSLRHIYMSDVICPEPLKIDALQNLETLTYISICDWTYEIPRLWTTGIRILGIEEIDENSDVSKLFASLVWLSRLERLTLRGSL